ncbi:MAG: cytochrome c [Anaerolineae bacterium]
MATDPATSPDSDPHHARMRRAGAGLLFLAAIAAALRLDGFGRTAFDEAAQSTAVTGAAAAPTPVAPPRPTYNPALWPTAAAGAPPPPADVVARGAALYDAHCATCHGANLEGQPDWKHSLPDGSLPAPPHDTSGHTWHHGDGELLRIIGQGGTIYMPNSKMPGFAGTLSDDEMRAVLAFIKTFWGAKELSWQANVTAGEVGPGTAP